MRKKKEIEFDPADYDYLDDPGMPLEGWVWEFERRSEDYKRAFVELNECGETFVEDLIFLEACCFDPSKQWCEVDKVKADLSKANPVEVINLRWGKKSPPHGKVYHVKINGETVPLDMTEEPEPLPIVDVKIKGNKAILTYENNPFQTNPFDVLRRQFGKENIVMALFDISAPQSVDDLLNEVKPYLREWRNTLKLPKVRDAKTAKKRENRLIKSARIWKSYLIVYDLIEEGMSFKEASDLLSEYDEQYGSEKYIERHYKAAERMINGGYKKYL